MQHFQYKTIKNCSSFAENIEIGGTRRTIIWLFNVISLREAFTAKKSQNCGLFPYHYPLFLKLIGNYELRNRDPIGTQHFMK